MPSIHWGQRGHVPLPGIVVLTLALASAASAGGSAASRPTGLANAEVAERVDIGGRSLFLRCSGSGAPTVILDTGPSNTHEARARVQPEVSPLTRVCSYDRAGIGGSDAGPPPGTARASVDDLRALLAAAGIAPPYLLVGHSWGGLSARVYARTYPDEVAGLVLVDAVPPNSSTGLRR
jgi:pimeloyl-ACP methyl ester carboxylesterase